MALVVDVEGSHLAADTVEDIEVEVGVSLHTKGHIQATWKAYDRDRQGMDIHKTALIARIWK